MEVRNRVKKGAKRVRKVVGKILKKHKYVQKNKVVKEKSYAR